mmetsp:Transcript_52648/g.111821  ORF Transcript_52648/g.111821 Transcript_52648/m.111821 type:complete len:381 (-) Transcript_52648:41-1183(-)
MLVVRDVIAHHQLPRPVRVQVVAHVVPLHLHVVAQLVEARRADQVASAVDLPRDGRVPRAHDVVASGARGRSGVVVYVLAQLPVDDHAADHVGVEVGLVVDYGEDLAVNPHVTGDLLFGHIRQPLHVQVAEDAVVEGRLVLIHGAAGPGGGMGPVDLVRLAHLHPHAVLPVVGFRELLLRFVVVVAAEPVADPLLPLRRREGAVGPLGTVDVAVRTVAVFVILTDAVVLRSQVPVHVHGAHALLVVGIRRGDHLAHVDLADVTPRDVRPRLGNDLEVGAEAVLERDLGPGARVDGIVGEEGRGRLALQVGGGGGVGLRSGVLVLGGGGGAADGERDAGGEEADGGEAQQADERLEGGVVDLVPVSAHALILIGWMDEGGN